MPAGLNQSLVDLSARFGDSSEMSDTVIAEVKQRFLSSPESVFDAWIDPAVLGTWLFGPTVRDEQIISLETDARVGGLFAFVVQRPMEPAPTLHKGEYLQVEKPARLVFSWGTADSRFPEVIEYSRVEIDISPRSDDGCELTLHHHLPEDWSNFVERTKANWSHLLGVMAKVLDGANEH